MSNLPIILLFLLPFFVVQILAGNEVESPKSIAPVPSPPMNGNGNANAKAQLRIEAKAHVERLNKVQKKWTAKLHPRFAEMPKEEKRRWLGLRRQDHHLKQKIPPKHGGGDLVMGIGMPPKLANAKAQIAAPKPNPEEHFDVRQKWPECADVINRIQDQSGCGSCWAVASASVMQDRICIGSGGDLKMNVSSEDILSCEMKSYGCEGGWPEYAFNFWHEKGVCSGGEFGSKKGCKPYPFPPHADHMYGTPRCKHRCENRYYKPNYKKDKNFGLKPVHLEENVTEEQIMDAIIEGGPVEADMVVFEDFFHYSSGVYEHDEDSDVAGGHAVRIIGWGFDNSTETDYWLVANSWNTDWGMDGLFKIARGQDECQIETWGINYAEANLNSTKSNDE